MTKQEIKTQIENITAEIVLAAQRCEMSHVDPRPWASKDHPLAAAHWALLQQRWALQAELKKPTITAEQAQARARRLNAARATRTNRAFSSKQIASEPVGDPKVSPSGLPSICLERRARLTPSRSTPSRV